MNKSFEEYWLLNRQQILNGNEEYRKVRDSYKVVSGADMLLYAIPIVAAVCMLDWSPMKNELLNWLVSALVAIVAFVVCTWVKTVTSNVRSLADIEEEIKRECREEYEKKRPK